MTDSNDVTRLFLNQTFRLYKANHSLANTDKLDTRQVSFLTSNIAKYLFDIYRSRSHELIPQYVSFRDILPDLKIITGTKNTLALQKVQYLIIKCTNTTLLPRQVLLFVSNVDVSDPKTFNTIVLAANTQFHGWLLGLLEHMEDDIPLLIKKYRLRDEYLPTITNQLLNKIGELKDTRGEHEVRVLDHLIGDIELVYASRNNPSHVINANLKNINIKIPHADVVRLISTREAKHKLNLVEAIHDHLHSVTKLNFHNLTIAKFSSNLFSITIDGKLRIEKMDGKDGEENHPVWFLVESVYNELMI